MNATRDEALAQAKKLMAMKPKERFKLPEGFYIHTDATGSDGCRANLKPCPFCGNEYPIVEHHAQTGRRRIRCTGCDVRTPARITEKLAAKIWNRRIIAIRDGAK